MILCFVLKNLKCSIKDVKTQEPPLRMMKKQKDQKADLLRQMKSLDYKVIFMKHFPIDKLQSKKLRIKLVDTWNVEELWTFINKCK
jgi:hypothetical protein